jgi:hypothetical protein
MKVHLLKNPGNMFSLIGQIFEADFGENLFTLLYEDNNKLILTEVKVQKLEESRTRTSYLGTVLI